jgi:hypothetical protein
MERRIEAYLERLVEVLQGRLGERLVAVSLVGGAAAGTFEPAASDIDVAVVAEPAPGRDELLALATALAHARLPVPARRLELVLYAPDGLREGRFALNLNTGEDADHAGTDPEAEDAFWFVLDLAIAREHERALVGPPLSELAPAAPRERLAAAGEQALLWFAGNEPGGPDTVLGACRSWCWALEDRWRTKPGAAAWARPRAPDPAVIDRALDLRRAGRRDGIDPAAAAPLVEAALRALRAVRTPAG